MPKPEVPPERVEAVLKAFNLEFGMLQKDVAKGLGVSRASLSSWKLVGCRRVMLLAMRSLWFSKVGHAAMAGEDLFP